MTATRRTGVARRDGAGPSSIAPSLARIARSPESGREKRWEKGSGASRALPSYGSSILIASAWVQCWHTEESNICNEARLCGTLPTSNPYAARSL